MEIVIVIVLAIVVFLVVELILYKRGKVLKRKVELIRQMADIQARMRMSSKFSLDPPIGYNMNKGYRPAPVAGYSPRRQDDDLLDSLIKLEVVESVIDSSSTPIYESLPDISSSYDSGTSSDSGSSFSDSGGFGGGDSGGGGASGDY